MTTTTKTSAKASKLGFYAKLQQQQLNLRQSTPIEDATMPTTANFCSYEESFAFYAPLFTEQYKSASRAKCEYAIEDINATLKLHDRNVYTGKLYAELDAARTRLQQYRNKSNRALRLSVI